MFQARSLERAMSEILVLAKATFQVRDELESGLAIRIDLVFVLDQATIVIALAGAM